MWVDTSIDVFVEIYDACGGALLDCGPGLKGTTAIEMCGDDQPTELFIRVIDYQGLDRPDLEGTMVVHVAVP